MLHSVGANATHGYPRSHDDKRMAVKTLLGDAEWSRWSDGEIARRCAVTQQFVSKLRASLTTVVSERTYTTKHDTVTTMKTEAIGRRAVEAVPSAEDRGDAWTQTDIEHFAPTGQTPDFPAAAAPPAHARPAEHIRLSASCGPR
jgi:hypothetical protein